MASKEPEESPQKYVAVNEQAVVAGETTELLKVACESDRGKTKMRISSSASPKNKVMRKDDAEEALKQNEEVGNIHVLLSADTVGLTSSPGGHDDPEADMENWRPQSWVLKIQW